MITLKTGAGFAASAAIVALSAAAPIAPAFAQGGAAKVHCYGINSCKGTSDCKTGAHECKGQNDCKGQGFKALTTKECSAAGGSTTEPK
jgi:uncharacterized membrane protein